MKNKPFVYVTFMPAKTKTKPTLFEPDYAIHPGVTVKEILDNLGKDQAEFADIIAGKTAIYPIDADRLFEVTKVPVAFWLKVQRNFDVRRETLRMEKLIKHWCPANLLHEGMPNTLVRAFMHATACCADQKRQLDGQQPIRPLSSYPDPMQGFKNTPTGF